MSSHAKKIGVLLPTWENGYEKGTPRSVDVVESARATIPLSIKSSADQSFRHRPLRAGSIPRSGLSMRLDKCL